MTGSRTLQDVSRMPLREPCLALRAYQWAKSGGRYTNLWIWLQRGYVAQHKRRRHSMQAR